MVWLIIPLLVKQMKRPPVSLKISTMLANVRTQTRTPVAGLAGLWQDLT